MQTFEQTLKHARAVAGEIVAIEACWDGDSRGWFVVLSAVTSDQKSHGIGCFDGGGDMRLFNGQVPPWPEAAAAAQHGARLASASGAEFYFPSPNHPEDVCPSWVERDKGLPCKRCGTPFLQSENCPWQGVCYYCHLKSEREVRESNWTPEQRAGPRCSYCGEPAASELQNQAICGLCLSKYDAWTCQKCGGRVVAQTTRKRERICDLCRLQEGINKLTSSQRDSLLRELDIGRLAGILAIRNEMTCSINDAVAIADLLDAQRQKKVE